MKELEEVEAMDTLWGGAVGSVFSKEKKVVHGERQPENVQSCRGVCNSILNSVYTCKDAVICGCSV